MIIQAKNLASRGLSWSQSYCSVLDTTLCIEVCHLLSVDHQGTPFPPPTRVTLPEFLPLIYPPELEVKETTDTASSASFLDLYLEFDDSGQLSTKIYDKRDDFNFKIINFPNMCSNIPASPAYGVYISQLIRYARASSNYSDFLKRHLHLRNRLLDQGYKKIRLIRSLKKFIFRYQYLVEIYSVSAEKIISDAFSYSENV